ncbi:MAG: hypothetical protein KatS3mg110_1538 [Pirellulaceae bacterium]|nr:MAG: hypothetical protein KatS3mg110_1538 [Pirellulaceae bacterium]
MKNRRFRVTHFGSVLLVALAVCLLDRVSGWSGRGQPLPVVYWSWICAAGVGAIASAAGAFFLFGMVLHRRGGHLLLVAAWFLLLLALTLVGELSAFRGLLRPLTIGGPSMAPTLTGTAWKLACPGCGYVFREPYVEQRWTTLCPLCGELVRIAPRTQLTLLPPEKLLVNTRVGKPERWQVWAFRDPANPETGQVKRVVGLPGEHIRIEHGDIWINGEIARKSWMQTLSCLVLVDDSRYQNRHRTRWRKVTLPDGTTWHVFGSWNKTPAPDAHRGQTDRPAWEGGEVGIARGGEDLDLVLSMSEMQAEGGELFYDWVVEIEADLRATAWIAWRVRTKAGDFAIRAGRTGRWELFHGERLMAGGYLTSSIPHRGRWQFACVDLQFFLVVDGRPLMLYSIPETWIKQPAAAAQNTTQNAGGMFPAVLSKTDAFAVGGPNEDCRILAWRVWRDIYYLAGPPPPGGGSAAAETRLDKHQYYVLGDNTENSADSRYRGPVSIDDALGHVWLCR